MTNKIIKNINHNKIEIAQTYTFPYLRNVWNWNGIYLNRKLSELIIKITDKTPHIAIDMGA